MHGLTLAAIAVLLAAASFADEERPLPAKERVRVFLLIGQSNMAGRGKPIEGDGLDAPHARVFALRKDGSIGMAQDPLHWDKPGRAGVGLGLTFAKVVAERLPEDAVLLAPAAFGGTSLTQWKPGGELYAEAVRRARIALGHGSLAGLLWHQGESGPKADEYPAAFAALIAALREDLAAPQAPVVLGGLAPGTSFGKAMNPMLAQLPERLQRCAFVASDGLTTFDGGHFDATSYREFGRRYAEAWCILAGATRPAGAAK